MLTVHHLGISQSERIVWLCEELSIPYELKRYERDPVTRLAPPDYKALHPFGTAPVITDGAVVLADTPFNLTLFAEEQVWRPEVSLGEDVESLWTGTSCIGSEPGVVHGRPVNFCTKQQFIDEVLAQISRCGALAVQRHPARARPRLIVNRGARRKESGAARGRRRTARVRRRVVTSRFHVR